MIKGSGEKVGHFISYKATNKIARAETKVIISYWKHWNILVDWQPSQNFVKL